jgi:hypothetical protein
MSVEKEDLVYTAVLEKLKPIIDAGIVQVLPPEDIERMLQERCAVFMEKELPKMLDTFLKKEAEEIFKKLWSEKVKPWSSNGEQAMGASLGLGQMNFGQMFEETVSKVMIDNAPAVMARFFQGMATGIMQAGLNNGRY